MRVAWSFVIALLTTGCAQPLPPELAPRRALTHASTVVAERGRAIDLVAADALRRKLAFDRVYAEDRGALWVVTLGLDSGIGAVYVVSPRNESIRAVRYVPPAAPALHAEGAR